MAVSFAARQRDSQMTLKTVTEAKTVPGRAAFIRPAGSGRARAKSTEPRAGRWWTALRLSTLQRKVIAVAGVMSTTPG